MLKLRKLNSINVKSTPLTHVRTNTNFQPNDKNVFSVFFLLYLLETVSVVALFEMIEVFNSIYVTSHTFQLVRWIYKWHFSVENVIFF